MKTNRNIGGKAFQKQGFTLAKGGSKVGFNLFKSKEGPKGAFLLGVLMMLGVVSDSHAQSLVSVSPATGFPSQYQSLLITGAGVNFTTASITSVKLINVGTPSYEIALNDTNNTVLTFTSQRPIPGDALLGLYDLQVIHSVYGTLTLASAFEVQECTGVNCVWPGDANSDGIANNFDVLSLGLAFGQTGSSRNLPTTNWQGQFSFNWGAQFPSGLNMKHADCNGGGTVGYGDTAAVSNNYNLSHSKGYVSPLPTALDPFLSLEILNGFVGAGDTLRCKVSLGGDLNPATDVYGLAFSILFDPQLIKPGSMKVSYANSEFGTVGTDLMVLSKQLNALGRMDFAFSRVDQTNFSFEGEIMMVEIVLIDDLAGINISQGLQLEIDDTKLINAGEVILPLNIANDSVGIAALGIGSVNKSGLLRVYPNPSDREVYIDSKVGINQASVLNSLGQKLITHKAGGYNQRLRIDLKELSAGYYFLEVILKDGSVSGQVLMVE